MLLIEKILAHLKTSSSLKALLAKARHYADTNYVLMVRLSDGQLMSRVKDDMGKIFTSYADLKNWQDKSYRCMCNQTMPCVHLLAGMMVWLDKHTAAEKKSNPIFSDVKWYEEDDLQDQTTWEGQLSGDIENGFQYQLLVEQQDENWNLVDVIVFLLESYSYQALLSKDDKMIFEIVHANGHKLRVAWWRIKWFLQRIIDNKLQIKNAKILIGNEWNAIQNIQSWSDDINDEHNLWRGNDAWQRMNWLLQSDVVKGSFQKPEGLVGELRPYQLDGIFWLKRLYAAGFGGILADDMGLGKTIQVLGYLVSQIEDGQLTEPALIVVPTSLLANWQEECHKFAPDLIFSVYHGKHRDTKIWPNVHLVITSYGMIQRQPELFKKSKFSHLILDEAQLIKNFQSQKSKVLKSLQATQRLCLTGTPMENHLGELWSLLDFSVPQLLGNRQQFKKIYQKPIEETQSQEVYQQLLSRISPFILRRSKQQVLDNLPKKTKIIQKISMEGEQLELYETLRSVLADKVQLALAEKGLLASRWVVLDALLKLRQICCDPALLPHQWNPGATSTSAKLDYLMEMLDNLLAENRSVLVFSQFTKMLHLIEERLKQKQISYHILTGKTQNRQDLVKSFQAGEVPIFLLSLKAGGLGLNLTRADTVIHYEPWWNPAVSAQATDRIYRIGQEQPVFEYHLVAAQTIEESMLELQEKKFDLFERTIEGASRNKMEWNEETIMRFFSPLVQ
jgi:SNF2 family DNA or RNA helicase